MASAWRETCETSGLRAAEVAEDESLGYTTAPDRIRLNPTRRVLFGRLAMKSPVEPVFAYSLQHPLGIFIRWRLVSF